MGFHPKLSLLRLPLQRTTAPRDWRFHGWLSYFHAGGRIHTLLPFPLLYRLSLSWNLTVENSFNNTTMYNILETIEELDYIPFLGIYIMVYKKLYKYQEGGSMALHYCSLHQRLFSRRCQRWVSFSPATIHDIRGYDDLLRSTKQDAAFLHVLELSCDHCAASVRPIAQRNAEDGVGEA